MPTEEQAIDDCRACQVVLDDLGEVLEGHYAGGAEVATLMSASLLLLGRLLRHYDEEAATTIVMLLHEYVTDSDCRCVQ